MLLKQSPHLRSHSQYKQKQTQIIQPHPPSWQQHIDFLHLRQMERKGSRERISRRLCRKEKSSFLGDGTGVSESSVRMEALDLSGGDCKEIIFDREAKQSKRIRAWNRGGYPSLIKLVTCFCIKSNTRKSH